MVGCNECARGFYDECELDPCPCEFHSPAPEPTPEEIKSVTKNLGQFTYKESEDEDIDEEILYDKPKVHKDEKSTGRKRAALLYPFICNNCKHTKQQHSTDNRCTKDLCDCNEFMWEPCEWKGLKGAGGGRNPIIGCLDGVQFARHHGPIKDTMRNELGNVHRVCATCHQHWHNINDSYYNEVDYMKLSHTPNSATEEEIFKDMLDWKTGKMGERYVLKSLKKVERFD